MATTKKTGTKPTSAKSTASARGKTGAAARKPATKPAQVKKATQADDDNDADAATAGGESVLGKKALFERVKARSGGVPGKHVREVMNLVLDELGAALVAGNTVRVPALGVLRVRRHIDQANADIVVCKLRRRKPDAEPKDPLAEAAE